MIFYSTKKEKHILEIKEDGIYLYEEAAEDITESLSRMTFSETKDQPRRVLLQKITLIGSGYDLVFSLVDAIVNRSLQVGFNFENDTYANNLRIIFCLLVPYVNSSLSFQYDIFHFITDLLLRKTKPIVLENNKVYIYRNKKNVLMYSTAKTGEVTLEDMPKTKSDKISTKKRSKIK